MTVKVTVMIAKTMFFLSVFVVFCRFITRKLQTTKYLKHTHYQHKATKRHKNDIRTHANRVKIHYIFPNHKTSHVPMCSHIYICWLSHVPMCSQIYICWLHKKIVVYSLIWCACSLLNDDIIHDFVMHTSEQVVVQSPNYLCFYLLNILNCFQDFKFLCILNMVYSINYKYIDSQLLSIHILYFRTNNHHHAMNGSLTS